MESNLTSKTSDMINIFCIQMTRQLTTLSSDLTSSQMDVLIKIRKTNWPADCVNGLYSIRKHQLSRLAISCLLGSSIEPGVSDFAKTPTVYITFLSCCLFFANFVLFGLRWATKLLLRCRKQLAEKVVKMFALKRRMILLMFFSLWGSTLRSTIL